MKTMGDAASGRRENVIINKRNQAVSINARFAPAEVPRRLLPEGELNNYSQRFSSRLALTPPKPKPFDSA
jgi:hypothetical protein